MSFPRRRESRNILQMKTYYVYILTNKRNGTLYIGVTNNLVKRMNEHKNNLIDGFSKRYNTHLLVYIETFSSIEDAILNEKRIKKWNRK